jgi:hypothetical protein
MSPAQEIEDGNFCRGDSSAKESGLSFSLFLST